MTKDGRTIPHEVLEKYRIASIKLHKDEVSVKTIAKSFSVQPQTVYRWIREQKKYGTNFLKSTKSSGPSISLTEKQIKLLKSCLRKRATALGYSTDLWSGPRVKNLIEKKFKIKYHQKHIPRLLKNLGLVLKFPERRALEQDVNEVRNWRLRILPKIIRYSRGKNALLFYADESIISLIPYVGKTWTFPNKNPIVHVSGQRGQNIGVTAAVNRQGRMCFELSRENEKFTAKTFLRFVRKLQREHKGRFIVLIVDGSSTHTAKIVKQFQKDNKDIFRLEIIPAYSPELNPTEKSWRFLKTKKLNGSNALNKSELRDQVKRNMRKIKNDKNRISTFFDEK